MAKDFLEEYFVKGAKECSSPEDILNWYRNLYYKEEQNTEHRIVAKAVEKDFLNPLSLTNYLLKIKEKYALVLLMQ